MSQFIIFPIHFKNKNAVDNFESFTLINNEFLEIISHSLMLCRHGCYIYTIRRFDYICMEAQRSLAEGVSIKETNLFTMINTIIRNTDEFFIWYGDEYYELDEATTADEAIKNIVASLKSNNGEIYLHYKSNR